MKTKESLTSLQKLLKSPILPLILTVILGLAVILTAPLNQSSKQSQTLEVGWAIAQSGSEPISEKGGLYTVKWHQSKNFGVAITSQKDIKVGDQILVDRKTMDYTGALQYIQYVGDWKPSGVTSW